MTFEIPLVDALSIRADCMYLSDLRYLDKWQRVRLARILWSSCQPMPLLWKNGIMRCNIWHSSHRKKRRRPHGSG